VPSSVGFAPAEGTRDIMEQTVRPTKDGSRAGMLVISPACSVRRSEITFRTSRSGGPGGQHVNKVETRVELLFDVRRSSSLSGVQRERILERLSARIDAGGVIHIVASASRSQWENKERAIEAFVTLVRDALKVRPVRKKTRPSASARERRLLQKKRRHQAKLLRRPPQE